MTSMSEKMLSVTEGEKRSLEQLESSLDNIRAAPSVTGHVKLIVCRPGIEQRQVIEIGELSLEHGLLGDNWKVKPCSSAPAGAGHPDMQLTLMNVRVIDAVTSRETWPLAGDQFYVDFDLSKANVPVGTRLQLGAAVVEVTAEPHLGCQKFQKRFGRDAVRFVNSAVGKELNMRGVNARVVIPGVVRTGDIIKKV